MLLTANFIFACYSMFNRGFAYLGIAPFYPAEVFLVIFILTRGNMLFRVLMRHLRVYDPVFLLFILFIIWGLISAWRGVLAGGTIQDSLKGFAAHYYSLFFFIGLVIGKSDTPARFADRFWMISIIGGIYGVVWSLALSHTNIYLPWVTDRNVNLFSEASSVLFLGIGTAALSPLMRRSAFLPMLILFVLLLGPVERAAIVGVMAGLAIVVAKQGNIRLFVQLILSVVGVFLLSALVGELLSIGGGVRSGPMTMSWALARLLSLFAPDQAYSMLVKMHAYDAAYQIYSLNADVDWRWRFWDQVITSLDSEWLWLMGHGYGISLGLFAGHAADVRTPHNFIFYFLGYTGSIGLIIFIGMLFSLFVKFSRLPRSPLKTFLLAELTAMTVRALAANSFETPFNAVPFYLILGLAYGIADKHVRSSRSNLTLQNDRRLIPRQTSHVSPA